MCWITQKGKRPPPVLQDGAAPKLRREVDELVERFLVAADIAESAQEGYRKALRQFFRWLEAEKLYPNTAAGVKGTKASRGHKKAALTPAQVAHILEVLKGEGVVAAMRDFAIVNLLIRTGLRTVELARADVGDIRAKRGRTVRYVHGKGCQSKDEFVVLTDAAVRPIYSYLALRETCGKDEPLFASLSNKSYGKRLTTRSVRRIAKNALVNAGFDDSRLTAHSMRHTTVSMALMGGSSLQQAQAMARHGNINTTMVYVHGPDRVSNAAELAIDDLLGDA